MNEINMKVRVFRYLYVVLFLVFNSTLALTRHTMENTLGFVLEIAWFLFIIIMLVSVISPRTLALCDDGSLRIGKKVYPRGTIKRITWSSGSRNTFQLVPNQWVGYRYVMISGWDGMKLDFNKTNIKFWAQQNNIEFIEAQRVKRGRSNL